MSMLKLIFMGNPWVTLAFFGLALACTPVVAQVHGCTLEAATDRTSEAIVDLDWDFGHSSCILVAPGTTVRWIVAGNWSLHPLTGGVSPISDNSNPISLAAIENDVASVTFDSPGAYPYFCQVHTTTMTGVVYVATPPPLVFEDGFEGE